MQVHREGLETPTAATESGCFQNSGRGIRTCIKFACFLRVGCTVYSPTIYSRAHERVAVLHEAPVQRPCIKETCAGAVMPGGTGSYRLLQYLDTPTEMFTGADDAVYSN